MTSWESESKEEAEPHELQDDTSTRKSPRHNNNNSITSNSSVAKNKYVEKQLTSAISTRQRREKSKEEQPGSRSLSPVATKVFYKINLRQKLKPKTNLNKHTCNACKKTFPLLHMYKKHMLCHSKPKTVVVNLLRHKLPDKTTATKFLKGKKKDKMNRKKRKESNLDSSVSDNRYSKRKSVEAVLESKNRKSLRKVDNSGTPKRPMRSIGKSFSTETAKKNSPAGKETSMKATKKRGETKTPEKKATDKSPKKIKFAKSDEDLNESQIKKRKILVENKSRSRSKRSKQTQEKSICTTCDESFIHLHEYKKHLLSHDKNQSRLLVNLINYELPESVKASEFVLCHTDKFTRESRSNPKVINSLLKKYIGEENLKNLGLDSYAQSTEEHEGNEKVEPSYVTDTNNEPEIRDENVEQEKRDAVEESTVEPVEDQEKLEAMDTTEIAGKEPEPQVSNVETEFVAEDKETVRSVSLVENGFDDNQEQETSTGTEQCQANEDSKALETEKSDAESSEDVVVEESKNTSVVETIEKKPNEIDRESAVEKENCAPRDRSCEQAEFDSSSETLILNDEENEKKENGSKNEEDVTINSKKTAEEACEEIVNKFCRDNGAEELLNDSRMSQESDLTDIIDAPEESQGLSVFENKNGTTSADLPVEAEHDLKGNNDVGIIEDISSISNFIRESLRTSPEESNKRKCDESPTTLPKKKVRFALSSEENSSEDNNDFALLMPSD